MTEPMQRSSERILTTHVGSLPRPDDLLDLLRDREDGKAIDQDRFDGIVRHAVVDVVRRQVEVGLDIVSDGEMSKISYATYLKDRVDGFGDEEKGHAAQDLLEYRDFARRLVEVGGTIPTLTGPCCIGELSLRESKSLEADLTYFTAAREEVGTRDAFLTAASPGVVSVFLANRFYPSHEAYLEALAGILRQEYEAIVSAGFILQLDCPDLAMGRHLAYADESTEAFRKVAGLHVAVLNEATRNIAPERMRLHLCWGNYAGPHHRDVALEDILDIVLRARPQAISLEGANPRHEHEWAVFRETALPDDKILIPGVIDSTSNFIEHPKLVAQRICRYADVVGRERLIAGADCGFATFAGYPAVHPSIAWAKLGALVEGAVLASAELW